MRLIYLSPVPWTSFCQRPHKFVEWFHTRSKEKILWVDPYPTRLPKFSDIRRINMHNSDEKKTPSWLTVLKPSALPIEPLPGSELINGVLWQSLYKTLDNFIAAGTCQIGIGKPSKLALKILNRADSCMSFYDAMDDFSAGYSGSLSRRSMAKNERALVKKVNKILVSSSGLYNNFNSYNSKMTLTLNACSINYLPPINTINNNPRVKDFVLGYVGTIAHWFNWQLVYKIARHNPLMKVRLIGPVYSPPPLGLPDNIEILSPCNHEAALQAMQKFSIGLIPFKLNQLTASVDPIKYYEYISLGLPVLSTKFGEMVSRNESPGVFLIEDDTDLKKIVDSALNYKADLIELQKFRMTNSWKVRFDSCNIFPG